MSGTAHRARTPRTVLNHKLKPEAAPKLTRTEVIMAACKDEVGDLSKVQAVFGIEPCGTARPQRYVAHVRHARRGHDLILVCYRDEQTVAVSPIATIPPAFRRLLNERGVQVCLESSRNGVYVKVLNGHNVLLGDFTYTLPMG